MLDVLKQSLHCERCGAFASDGFVQITPISPMAIRLPVFDYLVGDTAPRWLYWSVQAGGFALVSLVLVVALWSSARAVTGAREFSATIDAWQRDRSINSTKADRDTFCETRVHWLSVDGPATEESRRAAYNHLAATCGDYRAVISLLRSREGI